MTVKVYVEGGGDHNRALAIECRKGFSSFFERSGMAGCMPRVVACGGRGQAYDRFRTSHETGGANEFNILLVDSEGPVREGSAWGHVKCREEDRWECPQGALPDQLHLMIEAMEAWFHADKEALQSFYGDGFRPARLSERENIEEIPKRDLFAGLERATRNCQKGAYSKGGHSFRILALIDPGKVRASLPSADRLWNVLNRACGR